jgi:hypothetical protein
MDARDIGDGVYVQEAVERGMLILTTDSHNLPEATNTIYLERKVDLALIAYLNTWLQGGAY